MLFRNFILIVVFSLLLCGWVSSYGTLYVNNIVANQDTLGLSIEDVIIFGDSISVNGLFSQGVGSLDIGGVEFNYDQVTTMYTFSSSINIEGDLIIQNGQFYSNYLDIDNSGNINIYSDVYADGGISVNFGNFDVDPITQITTVANQINANGGIDINNGVFSVHSLDGNLITTGYALIEGDIYLTGSTNQYVTRFPSASAVGGNTYFSGQSASIIAGDLIIEPGYSATVVNNIGSIILGRQNPDILVLGRAAVTEVATAGGATIFSGQSANNGNGGDITFIAGSGYLAGGDLYLTPGNSFSEKGTGEIIIGSTVLGSDGLSLTITRPTVTSNVNCGTTYILGQSSVEQRGGALVFQAGNSTFSYGGDLYILPGQSTESLDNVGNIYLGTSNNDLLGIRRTPNLEPSFGSGGSFSIFGQSSWGGNGGDLIISAGNGNVGSGISSIDASPGVLVINPGFSSNNGNPGNIILGLEDHNLIIEADNDLTFFGQNGELNGGDFYFNAGDGGYNGGDINILSGTGLITSGSVTIGGGNSNVIGGDVFIYGGNSKTDDSQIISLGGDINFYGGSSTATNSVGGDVIFNSGNGNIVFTEQSGYISLGTQTNIQNSITISSNTLNGYNNLVISANASSVISFNGQNLVTQRPNELFVVLDVRDDIAENIARLQDALITLINALGPCGHGLITYANPSGTLYNSCLIN